MRLPKMIMFCVLGAMSLGASPSHWQSLARAGGCAEPLVGPGASDLIAGYKLAGLFGEVVEDRPGLDQGQGLAAGPVGVDQGRGPAGRGYFSIVRLALVALRQVENVHRARDPAFVDCDRRAFPVAGAGCVEFHRCPLVSLVVVTYHHSAPLSGDQHRHDPRRGEPCSCREPVGDGLGYLELPEHLFAAEFDDVRPDAAPRREAAAHRLDAPGLRFRLTETMPTPGCQWPPRRQPTTPAKSAISRSAPLPCSGDAGPRAPRDRMSPDRAVTAGRRGTCAQRRYRCPTAPLFAGRGARASLPAHRRC